MAEHEPRHKMDSRVRGNDKAVVVPTTAKQPGRETAGKKHFSFLQLSATMIRLDYQ